MPFPTNLRRGNAMLKKLSIVLSTVAVFGLGLALTMPQPSLAKDHHNKHQNKQGQKNVYMKKNVYVKKNKNVYVVGKKYHGHVWYGRNRHRWHDKWYDYGVGPCWIKIGDVWFWNELVCP
jgi:hypothetical protein